LAHLAVQNKRVSKVCIEIPRIAASMPICSHFSNLISNADYEYYNNNIFQKLCPGIIYPTTIFIPYKMLLTQILFFSPLFPFCSLFLRTPNFQTVSRVFRTFSCLLWLYDYLYDWMGKVNKKIKFLQYDLRYFYKFNKASAK